MIKITIPELDELEKIKVLPINRDQSFFILIGIFILMGIALILIKIIKYPFKDKNKGYYEGD